VELKHGVGIVGVRECLVTASERDEFCIHVFGSANSEELLDKRPVPVWEKWESGSGSTDDVFTESCSDWIFGYPTLGGPFSCMISYTDNGFWFHSFFSLPTAESCDDELEKFGILLVKFYGI